MSEMPDNLKAYLDGELTPEEAREVEAAIARDPSLQRAANEFRAISAGFQQVAASEPVGLETTLSALRRNAARPSWPLWGSWTLAAAGLVLIVGVALSPMSPLMRRTESAMAAATFQTAAKSFAPSAPEAASSVTAWEVTVTGAGDADARLAAAQAAGATWATTPAREVGKIGVRMRVPSERATEIRRALMENAPASSETGPVANPTEVDVVLRWKP